jgi:hypothetical protein
MNALARPFNSQASLIWTVNQLHRGPGLELTTGMSLNIPSNPGIVYVPWSLWVSDKIEYVRAYVDSQVAYSVSRQWLLRQNSFLEHSNWSLPVVVTMGRKVSVQLTLSRLLAPIKSEADAWGVPMAKVKEANGIVNGQPWTLRFGDSLLVPVESNFNPPAVYDPGFLETLEWDIHWIGVEG